MITTDALKSLPQMGLDPSWVVGCAGAIVTNALVFIYFAVVYASG
jgi:hypothetical protein